MGLFSFNYAKPGPGVDRDAPKKKGIFLYFELLTQSCVSPWPRYPLLMAFTQYWEANPNDQVVPQVIMKFLKRLK